MKSLQYTIKESLRIGLNDSPYTSKPDTLEKLREIIKQRFSEQGPGTKSKPIDFNNIDVSEFTSFYNESNNMGLFEDTEFKYIDISGWDTSNIKDMRKMFKGCKKLKIIYGLDEINTSNVENMQEMFWNCCLLESIQLFDTSNVKTMENMFNWCEKLQSVPQFNTSNVKSMKSMFSHCKSLQSVLLFDTSNVETMEDMFWKCTKLETVPEFNISKTKNIEAMFYNCKNLDENTRKLWRPYYKVGVEKMFNMQGGLMEGTPMRDK